MLFGKLISLPLLVAIGASALAIENPDTILERDVVKRDCYITGENWGDSRDEALKQVDVVCRNNFGGNYKGESERNFCRDLGSHKKVNFTVRRWHSSQGDMTFEMCQKYLRLEVKGCPKGGQSYQGNWRFRSDVNAGTC